MYSCHIILLTAVGLSNKIQLLCQPCHLTTPGLSDNTAELLAFDRHLLSCQAICRLFNHS